MTRHPRIELAGAVEPGFDEVLTADALEFVAELQRRFGPRREELLEARGRRRARLAEGEMLDFLPDTREIREGDWTVAPVPADLAAALGRDHRADRSQDDDQRAELGRRRVHGRLRGRQLADLAQHGRRPAQPARRDRRDDHLRRLRRQGTTSSPRTRPRCWCARAAGTCSSATCWSTVRADVRLAVRLRPVRVPLRPAADQKRDRAVLLPAEARVPPRGAAVERRVRVRAGGARDPARDDSRRRC